jgi:hypothetical protein
MDKENLGYSHRYDVQPGNITGNQQEIPAKKYPQELLHALFLNNYDNHDICVLV